MTDDVVDSSRLHIRTYPTTHNITDTHTTQDQQFKLQHVYSSKFHFQTPHPPCPNSPPEQTTWRTPVSSPATHNTSKAPLKYVLPPPFHCYFLTHLLCTPSLTYTPSGNNRQRNRQPSVGDLRRAGQEPSHRRDEGREREQGRREPGAGGRGGDCGEDCGVRGDAEGGGGE